MRKTGFAVLVLVALCNFGVWSVANRPVSERPWTGVITGVAVSPYQAHQNPLAGDRPSDADLERDLKTLAGHVTSIRTYSTVGGMERVPALAGHHGLTVTAGAWIQGKPEIDQPEIAGLIQIARDNPNVRRVIVGNEAILRSDITVAQAIQDITLVKSQVSVPVSTAEPWHVWLANPDLAEAADFIAVHFLPYWEGVPIEQAVDYALSRYNELKQKYPGKPILISEVGWPSDGPWRRGAEASQVNQARFIRNFLIAATQNQLDYYILEAFDQPWKRALEGGAGTAWGLWDAYRAPKFPMVGDIVEVPGWPVLWVVALALALGPMLWFLRGHGHLRPGGQFFYCLMIQGVASALVWTTAAAMTVGLATSTEIAWGVLLLCQVLLFGVMLIDGFELVHVVWTERVRRGFQPFRELPDNPLKVSIHLPCYNEPPQMVIQTLDALSRLDYPDFEVLVIDNNTDDEAVWRPLEAHCARLGERFRFFHLPKWPGYKAGALNFALDHTNPAAQVIAVIDSDYQVTPDWLRSMVPFFDRPQVGFVQSPQDYRNWQGESFKTMIHWEYAGFFHIGMVQRNEYNAIIQHGTMTLIRRSALEKVGRWAEWCITEDAELGLRLLESGYESVYIAKSFGQGLVPDRFLDYKTQRFRWAYGAVQILKHHWRELLPGAARLTAGQKYHFVTGWLPWFADAAHMVFGIAGILWSLALLLLPKYFEFPPNVFMVPTLSVFLFKIAACFWLYEVRVKCGFWNKLGAAVAGMALTHTVGRAVWQGLFTSGRPFVRTPKCEHQPAMLQSLIMAAEEVVLLIGLSGAALAIVLVFGHENRDAFLWSGLLGVQSLPYLAALVTSMINSWHGIESYLNLK
ncbi:Cellulose synthase/poly-beta-1,6-N-acetylglucosamine synthase-like glycosyltransferase/exo-beta-1,3-glucanase (GH17 family) [uncultured Gammaproteobacteria bacterium]